MRTATVTKIKGLSIQTQQNTFVLFTLFKLALDERKTLTKISTRKPLTTVPQTSAHLGRQRKGKQQALKGKQQVIQKKAVCKIGGESRGIRISSRNNRRIKKTTRLVLYKTLHYFCTKLASFWSIRF